ncbi:hypothetical protein PR048_029701 [Dryococelus australis]|uniref:Uncharacterized protein n=1 Tax=Dryococelus australis TaxID=614101 RepID=A0ABQ9GEQ7_9NEOP|nr:hypothetical protein PR048_029701 [Dryococelus australis]
MLHSLRTERTGVCLRRVVMACSKVALLDLSSESDSDDEHWVRYVVLAKRKRIWPIPYVTQHETFGEYHTLVKDLTEKQFKNYFRLSRSQFENVHDIIAADISKKTTKWRVPKRSCLR